MKHIITIVLGGWFILCPVAAQVFNCGVDSLVDIRDGKKYATVAIGTQCWMQQNLNYGQFVTSTVSGMQHANTTNNLIVEKYCQDNDSLNCDTLGGLYDWDEMMGYTTLAPNQGICPAGWHLPTDAEFATLVTYAGNSGNALKMLNVGMAPNGLGTNTSGFAALAGGDRDGLGVFYGKGLRFIFWTASESGPGAAWQYTLFAEDDSVAHLSDAGKPSGFSVRCIRDNHASGLGNGWGNSEFMVFPNPASNVVMVQNLTNQILQPLVIQVMSITGQYVQSYQFNQFPVSIDVKGYAKGIYYFQLSIGDHWEIQKIIIH